MMKRLFLRAATALLVMLLTSATAYTKGTVPFVYEMKGIGKVAL